MSGVLPKGFETLEPLVEEWALATQLERETKRSGSSKEDLILFFNQVFPEVPRILDACDQFPLGTLPPSHRSLYNLALSAAEIAPHVENYGGSPGVPHAFEERRFLAMHANHETWRNLPPSRG